MIDRLPGTGPCQDVLPLQRVDVRTLEGARRVSETKEEPMLSLLMLLGSTPVVPTPARPAHSDPPVHVWLSSQGNYAPGDRAKAYVRAGRAGYLVVLHADPEGRVRVLFPIDPRDDQRVEAGKKYELKGRGGHEPFMVDDTTGHGIVLAALSQAPFRFDEFAQNDRWDYAALAEHRVRGDPEAGLLNLVQRMQPADSHFDYDVATYVVSPANYARWGYPYPYPGAWGWAYGPRLGVGFGFGRPYYYRRWGWWP